VFAAIWSAMPSIIDLTGSYDNVIELTGSY
jgi:hypothetical protein